MSSFSLLSVSNSSVASYQREIDRLKSEIEARKRTAQTHIDWHTAPIESYHRMRQEQDADMRTLRTPHATSKITVPTKPDLLVSLGGVVPHHASVPVNALACGLVVIRQHGWRGVVDVELVIHRSSP